MREIQQINGITRELTVDALDLFVCYKQGEEIVEDCPCDSVFMKMTMRTVANEICNYFFWVPLTTTIYLVMDKAGVHGTNETIEEYRNIMLKQYNIKLFHQIPNSSETNLLDPGVWCAMQSKVESLGYQNRQDPCVLAQAVEKV